MARIGDVPKLVRSVGLITFARRVIDEVNKDNLFTWAAALAYSWLFAVFPFFLFLLAMIAYLPVSLRNQAHDYVKRWVDSLPPPAADTVWVNIADNLHNLLHQPRGLVLYSGLLISLWAASSGMAATMSALDRCYELDRGRSLHRHRLLAMAMTVAAILLMLAVVCLLPVGSAVRDWLVQIGAIAEKSPLLLIFDVIRWVLAVLFIFGVLAMIYYKGPNVKHRFHWLTPGSVFCVVVWLALAFLFRLYIVRIGGNGYDRTYGTVGGVAVLLLFFYIDALVLLIGAEINSEIDFEVLKVRRGSRDFRKAEEQDVVAAA